MKQKRTLTKVLFASLTVLFILACSAGSLSATATPAPTNTPAATNTPLPTNTLAATDTPLPPPTETEIPPTPSPVEVGVPVTYGSLEITLMAVATHDLIVPGGKFYWYSKPGETYLDLGVSVKNLTPGSPVKIQWNQIYFADGNGDTWSATFGDYKTVSSGKLDPFSVGINTEVKPDAFIEFDNDTYLRLIYYTAIDTTSDLFFGIESSPQVRFQMEKK